MLVPVRASPVPSVGSFVWKTSANSFFWCACDSASTRQFAPVSSLSAVREIVLFKFFFLPPRFRLCLPHHANRFEADRTEATSTSASEGQAREQGSYDGASRRGRLCARQVLLVGLRQVLHAVLLVGMLSASLVLLVRVQVVLVLPWKVAGHRHRRRCQTAAPPSFFSREDRDWRWPIRVRRLRHLE